MVYNDNSCAYDYATEEDEKLQDIMRDLKGYTSRVLLKTIEENSQESRREWILGMMKRAGEVNCNNERYQFWQQHNQPIVPHNADIFEQKLNYLLVRSGGYTQ